MSIYQSEKVLPYVYRLDHPVTGEFYIGYRSANKLPSDQDLPKYRTSSKKVKPRFNEFNWCVVAEFFDSDAAYDFEQKLIHENWNNKLLINMACQYNNKTRFKFHEHSEASREKLRLAGSGSNHRLFGKKTPEATKEKIRSANLGENCYNYGMTLSDETKYKMRVSHLGKVTSDETRNKQRAANKGQVNDILTCPHCGKSAIKPLMVRWHFDNCKSR